LLLQDAVADRSGRPRASPSPPTPAGWSACTIQLLQAYHPGRPVSARLSPPSARACGAPV